jgi:hypothetical protein
MDSFAQAGAASIRAIFVIPNGIAKTEATNMPNAKVSSSSVKSLLVKQKRNDQKNS